MKIRRIRRRWKVLAAGIMALACIGIGFNIWFVHNTNAIIESLVSASSNGRIQLQVTKSSFHYLNKKIIVHGATFYSDDTSGAATTYQFQVPKLDLKIRSFWSFLIFNELLIDSISLNKPMVTVTRLSKAVKQDNESISIPEEIGRIYNSIIDALQVLQVRRFQLVDGTFHLVNKIDINLPVTTISYINFNINNLKITDDSSRAEKFLFSDDMVLRVKAQEIALPDGIHHISFRDLHLNVGRKQVELDSCWLKAITINNRNEFRIFFDKLKMTNLDFAALYQKNLIKADSVYINNPDIELALDLKRKKESGKKFELDTIIQQFTGDLALGYIGVQNAAVNIVVNRGDTATTFSSKNDNFQMVGLRVNSDSAQPVHVDEFAMILRKYETYSRDSTTLYRFDSLRFTNKKVRLSNFSIETTAANANKGSLYYAIPVFELTGISWEDLLFDRYIRANKALLLNPEIQYSIGATKRKTPKASLFKILSGLNESINLEEVEIRNGNLNIQLPAGKRLNLTHVNLVLASNQLLASQSYTGMQQAINELAFRNAIFTTGNLRAELKNLQYSDRLYADELHVTTTDKSFEARANGVTLNDLIWNNLEKSVFVDHMAWKRGTVIWRTGTAKSGQQPLNAIIEVSNFIGNNTALTIYANDNIINTRIDKLALNNLLKKGADPLSLKGLVAEGKRVELLTDAFGLNSGAYHIVDKGTSTINDISFSKTSLKDSIHVQVSQTRIKNQIEDLLQGKLHFENITALAPVFTFTTNPAIAASTNYVKAQSLFPKFSIEEFSLLEPVVTFRKTDSINNNIQWAQTGGSSKRNHWTFYNVHTTPKGSKLGADKAVLVGSKVLYNYKEKSYGVDSGQISINLKNISLSNTSGLQWQAHLEEAVFKNPISLSLKEQGGIGMQEARLRNVNLSGTNVSNVYRLLQSNPDLQLQVTGGSLATGGNQLQWKNLLYLQHLGVLSVDSFSYKPTLERDSFIAKAPGQVDYMHAVLKNITATGIDLTALERDSVFSARSLALAGSDLSIYRDKQKPFISGGFRPLPALLLHKIPAKIAVDTVSLHDATVRYTEMSARTMQEGSISINRINAQLFPVRNINISDTDSLTLHAEGYLMDSAWLRLRLKESYTDSLGTFAMTLRMKPTDLSVFNPALMPMASVKLVSGELDTVTMRAIGNDYFSIGEMQMYYKDLKVQFLKKGSTTKKTILTDLITFAANNFIIRKNNVNRTGTVYFLRNRDRSVFNFLIKTALSGIASSVGAKKNKKYNRQYKRQQKLYKLPPVDFN